MKVAVLLSGLPRMVEEGYLDCWKSIIDNYDTDIYLHSWKDLSWGCNWETVLNTYSSLPQTKSIHIQTPFKFTKYKEGIQLPHTDKSRPLPEYDVMSCFRQLPMFYSWQKVYQNMFETNIHYDCIIRSRYDVKINQIIDLNDINLNNLNVAPSENFYDDNLCISNYKNSFTIFKSIFDNVLQHSRNTGILNSAENTWTNMIHISGINVSVDYRLSFSLLRNNLLWWGDEHGNVI